MPNASGDGQKMKASAIANRFSFIVLAILFAAANAFAKGGQCEPQPVEDACSENAKNDPKIKPMVDQLKGMQGSTASLGKSASQCDNQRGVQEKVRDIANAQAALCKSKIDECKQKCDEEIQQARQQQPPDKGREQQAQNKKQRCQSFESRIPQLQQAAGEAGQNAGTNQQCNEQQQQQPQQQPQQEQPKQDEKKEAAKPLNCNDPTMAKDPKCPQIGGTDGGLKTGSGDDGSGGRSNASSLSPSGLGSDPTGTSFSEGTSTAPSSSGGSGGSGGFAGFGSGSSSPNAKVKEQLPPIGKPVAAATEGGGGGGGGGRGGGGPGQMPPDPQLIERHKRKGLGGMTVKAVDGITGPMGDSLFEKISKQYKRQASGMISD